MTPPPLPATITEQISKNKNTNDLNLDSTQNIGSTPTYTQANTDTTANAKQMQYDLRGINQNSLISRAKYALTEKSLQAERVEGFRQILEQLKQR